MKIGLMLIIAFVLDLLLKDKKLFPLRKVINNTIKYFEIFLRKIFRKGKTAEIAAGSVMTIVVVSVSFILPFVLLSLCYYVNMVLGIVVEIILCFQILGLGYVKDRAMKVYSELYTGNIEGAKYQLKKLVQRDTDKMDENSIVQTTIESVSKHTNDKVAAPLFYMIIGGASLGMVYKAVNILDSLIGYKTKKYIYFGLTAAKLDDILNIIPARITGFLYVVAALLSGFDYKSSYKILVRDRWNHASPNSGYPESALAGALGIQLGGSAYYNGEKVERKYIGDNIKEVDMEDIPKSCMLMTLVSVLSLTLFVLAKFAILFIAEYSM